MVGVTTTRGAELKGCGVRKGETHCSRLSHYRSVVSKPSLITAHRPSGPWDCSGCAMCGPACLENWAIRLPFIYLWFSSWLYACVLKSGVSKWLKNRVVCLIRGLGIWLGF